MTTNHSGQIIIFHPPKYPWNIGISLPQLHFGLRSCEVAIIWPEPSELFFPAGWFFLRELFVQLLKLRTNLTRKSLERLEKIGHFCFAMEWFPVRKRILEVVGKKMPNVPKILPVKSSTTSSLRWWKRSCALFKALSFNPLHHHPWKKMVDTWWTTFLEPPTSGAFFCCFFGRT